MPNLHTYRIFISHAWRYSEPYNRIIKLLDDAPNFKYANYSVPKPKGFDKMSVTELKDEIRDQIRYVDCVIILGGMYVSYSSWIQFEIDFAKEKYKPIIGVKPWASTVVPKPVSNAANEIVGWNTSSIVTAIRRARS